MDDCTKLLVSGVITRTVWIDVDATAGFQGFKVLVDRTVAYPR